MDDTNSCIVVGVFPGQTPEVVDKAAVFAKRFGVGLVCASVDPSRFTVERRGDGSVVASPIDTDIVDTIVEVFDAQLEAQISETLKDRGVEWSVRALAGSPARELSELATELNAAMIVVGTREAGLRGSMREFFNGSVAVQLAHRQHRPVVVVPLRPVLGDDALPWQVDD